MIDNAISVNINSVGVGISDASNGLNIKRNDDFHDNGASYDLLSKIEDHWKNNEESISHLLLNMDKRMENPTLFMEATHHHKEFVAALSAAQGGIMSSIKTIQQTNG